MTSPAAGQAPATNSPEAVAAALLAALGAHDRAERARAIEGASEMVDPDHLIEAVADQVNARRRNAAMDALARGGARSVPALVRALRHQDPEVVMFSAGVLARTGSPAAIPHLVSLLDHEDVNIAQQVIDSLSQLRSALAVDALLRVLDRDPWLRFAAVHALGEIGDHRAVSALAPLLEDESVREAVIGALGKIGSAEALSCLFRVLRDSANSETFASCLHAIGEALEFRPNEEALQNIAEWTSLSAATSRELQERLRQVLLSDGGEDEMVGAVTDTRRAAALIIKALKVRPLYTSLVLAGRDPSLRDVLEFSMVSLGDEIVPSLERGLEAGNPNVRVLACTCMGAMGRRTAAPRLQALLGDPEPEVRAAAIGAVMRLGHDEAIPAIGRCLTDPDAAVRKAAVAAFCRMDVEAVTRTLLAATTDGTLTPQAALAIMRANPHPSQGAYIAANLTHDDPEVRRAAVEALAKQASADVVSMLEPRLGDPDREVRRAVVDILGGVRSGRVRQLLARQVERDPQTRSLAVRALGNMGDTTVIPLLISLFDDEPVPSKLAIIEALAALPDPATEAFLARQLGSPEAELRRAAVAALGRIGSATAFRQIVPAARDADESVRLAVAQALGPSPEAGAKDALARLALDPSRRIALVARQSLERAEG